jgi:hypothetical protein
MHVIEYLLILQIDVTCNEVRVFCHQVLKTVSKFLRHAKCTEIRMGRDHGRADTYCAERVSKGTTCVKNKGWEKTV